MLEAVGRAGFDTASEETVMPNSRDAGVQVMKGVIDTCKEAWALRIIDSSHIYLYGGGFYSFFKDYKDTCAKTGGTCQERVVDIDYSEEIWIYSLYTVGSEEIISPQGKEVWEATGLTETQIKRS
jgi:hypothetical protein